MGLQRMIQRHREKKEKNKRIRSHIENEMKKTGKTPVEVVKDTYIKMVGIGIVKLVGSETEEVKVRQATKEEEREFDKKMAKRGLLSKSYIENADTGDRIEGLLLSCDNLYKLIPTNRVVKQEDIGNNLMLTKNGSIVYEG